MAILAAHALHFLTAQTCSASSIPNAHAGIGAAAVDSCQRCPWGKALVVPSSDHHAWVDVAIAGYQWYAGEDFREVALKITRNKSSFPYKGANVLGAATRRRCICRAKELVKLNTATTTQPALHLLCQSAYQQPLCF